MREIVIEETMGDMDKDKDGFVTIEEYISEYNLIIEIFYDFVNTA